MTSRIPLRVSGEHDYPVPPLETPSVASGPRHRAGTLDAALVAATPAVRLFVDRSLAVQPRFELTEENAPAVAEIVTRLDGLPLAIEPAAARSRLLTPEAMLDLLDQRKDLATGGMRDLPARQRTLRGAIAWSHDLLDEVEQRLFARFAVFVGGATLEDAEVVCGSPSDLGMDVLSGLEALVDHSLIRQLGRAEPRLRMLVTIREFALEQLAAGGEEQELRQRHAARYLQRADELAPLVLGESRRECLDDFERENDNLRAALAWAIGSSETALALRMVGAEWRFWQMRGHLSEGIERAAAALAMPRDPAHDIYRVAVLEGAGGLAYWLGDHDASDGWYEELYAMQVARGDEAGIARAVYNRIFSKMHGEENLVHARALAEEAIGRYERLGDAAGVAMARWALGNVGITMGDLELTRTSLRAAIAYFRQTDERFNIGWSVYMLGLFALKEQKASDAEPQFQEALTLFSDDEDVSGIILVLEGLAASALGQGESDRAARIAGAVDHLEHAHSVGLIAFDRLLIGYDPALTRTDAKTIAAWDEGAAMDLREVVSFARRLSG